MTASASRPSARPKSVSASVFMRRRAPDRPRATNGGGWRAWFLRTMERLTCSRGFAGKFGVGMDFLHVVVLLKRFDELVHGGDRGRIRQRNRERGQVSQL